jgi:hypothetical protein
MTAVTAKSERNMSTALFRILLIENVNLVLIRMMYIVHTAFTPPRYMFRQVNKIHSVWDTKLSNSLLVILPHRPPCPFIGCVN